MSQSQPTRASDLMTPSPRTCSPHSSILEAVLIFRDADCGAVPVTEGGRPVGILTDRDVALALAEYPDLANRPVADIMTQSVVTIGPDEPLEVVEAAFTRHAVRRLPVVDAAGQILGIIAWSDLAPNVADRRVGQVVSEVLERH